MKKLLAALIGLFLISPAAAQFNPSGSAVHAQSASAAASIVAKAGPGGLFSASAVPSVNGYLMLFDATSAPADGAVAPVASCYAAANTGCSILYGTIGVAFTTGITLVFSTTGPFTKTASASALLTAQYQ